MCKRGAPLTGHSGKHHGKMSGGRERGNDVAAYNQKVPDKGTLRRWHDEGLTHQQMAERILEETGERVSRSAVSMALQRHGITDREKPRYRDEVPWRVRVQHLRAYPVRMLRLLGRRRAGEELDADAAQRLAGWLATLAENNAVVAYDPDTDEGFLYVAREPGDPEDIPIRRERVWVNPPKAS